MGREKLSGLIKNTTSDYRKKRIWQTGIGIGVFVLFVLSSLLVNQTVQALNQAAGSYGYYGGTYGYNASYATSDQVPSAPSSLSCSASSTSAGSCSWTAPTTTTDGTLIATGGGSISSYNFHYNTSSLSACSGGTSSTPTSASASLTGLTQNTTYYVAVCAVDNNSNEGSVATSSFTTSAYSGGGSSGSVANNTLVTPSPTTTTTTTTTPTVATPSVPTVTTVATVADGALLAAQMGVARNTTLETASMTKVVASATEFKVTLGADVKTVAANFVTYGTSPATVALGSGERLAVIRDVLEILGTKVANDASALLIVADQISNGQKPTIRNLTKEQSQVPIVLKNFEKLVGHRPNFKNAKEDLAWNTMQYRVRFVRSLAAEKVGIVKFKALFNKIPKTPFDWATVRAWGYALK